MENNKYIFVRLFLFQIGWLWLLSNFAISKFHGSTLIILIRDSWMISIPFIFLLFQRYIELLLLIFYTVFSILNFLTSTVTYDVTVLAYGYRNLAFILLCVSFISKPFQVTNEKNEIKLYSFVIYTALLSGLVLLYDESILNYVFDYDGYYSSKGVSLATGFGFFGLRRLMDPFYSPNLLGTFVASYFLTKTLLNSRERIYYFNIIVGIGSVSKILLIPFVFLVKRKKINNALLLSFVFVSFAAYYIIDFLINEVIVDDLLKYHVGSIGGHLFALIYLINDSWLLNFSGILGASSIFADSSTGLESLLVSIFLDLGIFSFPLIIYLIYAILKVNFHRSHLLNFFILTILLTMTSNHPIVFLPLLYWVVEARK
jgi:hypothetical protein